MDALFTRTGQDPLYELIRTRKAPKDLHAKAFWNEIFSRNRQYLDKTFSIELACNFLARLWELTLLEYLNKFDVDMLIQSGRHSKPDFKFKLKDEIFYLEAIAVSSGKVTSLQKPIGKAKFVPINEYKERLCAAFIEKAVVKYNGKKGKGYKNVVRDSDGLILAISMGEIDFQNQPGDIYLALSCFFGFSDRKVDINTGEFKYDFEPAFLKKSSPIDVGYFINDNYSHVSAVILSHSPFVHYPGYEDFLVWPHCKNDFVLIHNPFAKVKLPRRFFSVCESYEAMIQNNRVNITKISAIIT